VALNARIEVTGAGNGAKLTGKQMEVRAADTDRLGAHDNVSGTGRSRIGNVLEHHLTG